MRRLETLRASAPTRICDNGGWTDTWFAEHGRVFSIAIEPRVHVELSTYPRDGSRPHVVIDAKAFGDRYAPAGIEERTWGRHPLLEATIAQVGVPTDRAIEVVIDSDAPHGASTGTSASLCVALVSALDGLTPGRLSPTEVAMAAWRVETEQLGQQSGIQDQLAAAFGGINLFEIERYPDADVQRVEPTPGILDELERRLILVYLGAPHSSSTVHEAVIRDMEDLGPTAAPIEALRQTARPSRDALLAGDFELLGQAMIANTTAQTMLHPELVSPTAWQVIEVANRHGIVGHKVNGAGGDGGSITLLADGEAASRSALIDAVEREVEGCRVLPIKLSADGVRVRRC